MYGTNQNNIVIILQIKRNKLRKKCWIFSNVAVMFNFTRQLDERCQETHDYLVKHYFWLRPGGSQEETSMWIAGLSEAEGPSVSVGVIQAGEAWAEQEGEGG